MISILCAIVMGFALGALGLLGFYIAMVLAIGLACAAVFGPFAVHNIFTNGKNKGK